MFITVSFCSLRVSHFARSPTAETVQSPLDLTDHERDAVHTQDDVEPFATGTLRISPLIRDDEVIVRDVIVIEELDADRASVLTKREAVLLEHQLAEALVLGDEILRTHRIDKRSQLVDDRVGTGRILGDARIEALQRLLELSFQQHASLGAPDSRRRTIRPSVRRANLDNHLLGIGFRSSAIHFHPLSID